MIDVVIDSLKNEFLLEREEDMAEFFGIADIAQQGSWYGDFDADWIDRQDFGCYGNARV